MMDDAQRRLHWRGAMRHMGAGAAAVLVCGLAAPLAAPLLDAWFFLRFPLGYGLVAHAAVAGLIAVVFWCNGRQDELDRRHGVTNGF